MCRKRSFAQEHTATVTRTQNLPFEPKSDLSCSANRSNTRSHKHTH